MADRQFNLILGMQRGNVVYMKINTRERSSEASFITVKYVCNYDYLKRCARSEFMRYAEQN